MNNEELPIAAAAVVLSGATHSGDVGKLLDLDLIINDNLVPDDGEKVIIKRAMMTLMIRTNSILNIDLISFVGDEAGTWTDTEFNEGTMSIQDIMDLCYSGRFSYNKKRSILPDFSGNAVNSYNQRIKVDITSELRKAAKDIANPSKDTLKHLLVAFYVANGQGETVTIYPYLEIEFAKIPSTNL